MKPVVFHPDAEAELEAAIAWHEKQRAGLGRELRVEFEAALGRLTEHSQAYAIEAEGLRACPLRRFSYTVFYAELNDRIWLAAVAHQSRRPAYWKGRRPE